MTTLASEMLWKLDTILNKKEFVWFTHLGRVTHRCVINLTFIGPGNGSSPGRRPAINWASAGILLTWSLRTNFFEVFIVILTFSFKKIHLKITSINWRPFCLGLNELMGWHSARVYPYLIGRLYWRGKVHNDLPVLMNILPMYRKKCYMWYKLESHAT